MKLFWFSVEPDDATDIQLDNALVVIAASTEKQAWEQLDDLLLGTEDRVTREEIRQSTSLEGTTSLNGKRGLVAKINKGPQDHSIGIEDTPFRIKPST